MIESVSRLIKDGLIVGDIHINCNNKHLVLLSNETQYWPWKEQVSFDSIDPAIKIGKVWHYANDIYNVNGVECVLLYGLFEYKYDERLSDNFVAHRSINCIGWYLRHPYDGDFPCDEWLLTQSEHVGSIYPLLKETTDD